MAFIQAESISYNILAAANRSPVFKRKEKLVSRYNLQPSSLLRDRNRSIRHEDIRKSGPGHEKML